MFIEKWTVPDSQTSLHCGTADFLSALVLLTLEQGVRAHVSVGPKSAKNKGG